MKTSVRRAIRDEKGAALALALVLLVVGGLILTPLLGLMSTGLMAGQVYERKTDELYAADAGVEDAVWQIQTQVPEVGRLYCGAGNHTWSYNISDVNGKEIAVTLEYVDRFTYRVVSEATGDGTGTRIVAHVTGVSSNYSSITDHIVTSQSGTDIKNKVTLNYTGDHGPVEYYEGSWPTATDLEDFYSHDVNNATHYPSDTTIDLMGNDCPPGPIYIGGNRTDAWSSGLGPLYVAGKLDIDSSDNAATLQLAGTLYVTGAFSIGTGNAKDVTIDLAGQTIFVGGAVNIGNHCTINGPGAIVALGNIYIGPMPTATVGTNENPVFLMSTFGTTEIQPGMHLYGALAGSTSVDMKNGGNPKPFVSYPTGGFEGVINFPGCIPSPLAYSIASWEISPA
jgi:hypothetical protein